MRKFIMRFVYVKRIKTQRRVLGGKVPEHSQSTATFDLLPLEDLETKARVIWNKICGSKKYSKHKTPEFKSLEEILATDWSP